jgi:2-succinyl-5-enolpyruvyl-6-hydroxy-3-cyclohexene-1-carboxylate synthase
VVDAELPSDVPSEAPLESGPGVPVLAAATFCATLVDEWARAGVTDAVIAPGSRSTPLALALVADDRIGVHVVHDERSAAFVALGAGLASGRPAIVLTTSGTAAAELHPAVVEAHHAAVPLIVCTADRPPELRDVGAPQAIDQMHLFGRSARWFVDPGVPDDASAATWRSTAARTVAEACGPVAGPVHVNLPFRDPLTGTAGPLPPGRAGGEPWHQRLVPERRLDHEQVALLARHCARREGVIVAGWGVEHPEAVLVLAHTLGWPVLADPRSGCRLPDAAVVAHFDAVVRGAGDALTPEVVLRLGAPPASRMLAEWVSRTQPTEIVVTNDGAWFDPGRHATLFVDAEPSIACRELAALVEDQHPPTPWLARWGAAQRAAATAIARVIGQHEVPTEPAIARDVVACVPDDGTLVVSSSMPVRDVEWFAAPREGGRVLANRGANGIDGVVSTALGAALASSGPTVALVGDLGFIHDSNGLLQASRRQADLTVVVVDNDGGGIFSFLPQAELLDRPTFETLFGTPHGIDLAALASAYGVAVHVVDRQDDLRPVLHEAMERGGCRVVLVRTERRTNVEVHAAIHSAVNEALAGLPDL